MSRAPQFQPTMKTIEDAAEAAGRADYCKGDVSFRDGAARWVIHGSTAAYQRGWNRGRDWGAAGMVRSYVRTSGFQQARPFWHQTEESVRFGNHVVHAVAIDPVA